MGMEGAELFPDKGGEGRLHIEKIEPSWTGFIQHYQPYITLTEELSWVPLFPIVPAGY